MISVQNLTKRFGEVVAVDNATFEVEAGEVMGFLGPNGAGKTTTLRILTGFIPATLGTARVDGFDVLKDSRAVRQRIGYLPEQVPLYLDMRVEEYLRYRGLLKGTSRKEIQQSVGEAMEHCGLTHMARRIVGQLSKGYRQRVGLADALVSKPKILILDEPTGGLDPHQRKEVLDLIKSLAQMHTILLSSHVLAEVESISDRVMIIQRGELLAVGRPDELNEQLQESPRIRLEVQGTEDEIRRCVELLSLEDRGVVGIHEQEDGWHEVLVKPASGRDPRLQLVRNLREANLEMRELTRLAFSLEELFLRITAQAAQEVG